MKDRNRIGVIQYFWKNSIKILVGVFSCQAYGQA